MKKAILYCFVFVLSPHVIFAICPSVNELANAISSRSLELSTILIADGCQPYLIINGAAFIRSSMQTTNSISKQKYSSDLELIVPNSTSFEFYNGCSIAISKDNTTDETDVCNYEVTVTDTYNEEGIRKFNIDSYSIILTPTDEPPPIRDPSSTTPTYSEYLKTRNSEKYVVSSKEDF